MASSDTNALADRPVFAPAETVVSASRDVCCDGGDSGLGHPLVWYKIGDSNTVTCRYCGRHFVFKSDTAPE